MDTLRVIAKRKNNEATIRNHRSRSYIDADEAPQLLQKEKPYGNEDGLKNLGLKSVMHILCHLTVPRSVGLQFIYTSDAGADFDTAGSKFKRLLQN
jgi:hypothetical protein